jgi:hypothetical protein
MEVVQEAAPRAPGDLAPAPGDDAPSTPGERPPGPRAPIAPRAVLIVAGILVAAGVVVRFVTRSDLWLDEALSVNIARLPFSDLREALRHDGAPPLYYVLLHLWTDVFGTGDVAVRALSGVVSIATLPLAWFAGRRLGRSGPPGPVRDDSSRTRLVAALVVLVFATSPYMIRYATETRMYSLVMLLVTAGYLALRRAFEKPSLLRLGLVAFIAGAMLYTQYWTMYLLAVVGLGVVALAFRGRTAEVRHAARGVVVAFVAALILFLPWLGTFLYQAQHTGTPWGDPQLPWTALRQALDQFSGGTSILHDEGNLLSPLLVVLLLLALFGAGAGDHDVDLDLHTRSAVRWEAVAAISALVLGLFAAYASGGAFDARYASMMFPLFLFVVAYGFTVFTSRAVLAGALAVFVAAGAAGAVRNVLDQRTEAGKVESVIAARARPGDVVAYCPDQLGPAVSRLLGDRPGLTQLTFPHGDPPELIDWVDYREAIDRTDPATFAQEVLAAAGNHTIWYVATPGYRSVENKCEAITEALASVRPGSRRLVKEDQDRYFEADNLYEFPAA